MVQTANVEKLMVRPFAHVYQIILDLHRIADQSVWSALSVQLTKLVSIKNASTLVQELAGKTLNVM